MVINNFLDTKPPKNLHRAIVIAERRSGSTYLLSCIEGLNNFFGDSDIEDIINKNVFNSWEEIQSDFSLYRIHGFNSFWHPRAPWEYNHNYRKSLFHSHYMNLLEYLSHNVVDKIVVHRRDDIFRSALSNYVLHIDKLKVNVYEEGIDINIFLQYYVREQAFNRQLTAWINTCLPQEKILFTTYEDLVDMQVYVDRLVEWTGVPLSLINEYWVGPKTYHKIPGYAEAIEASKKWRYVGEELV